MNVLSRPMVDMVSSELLSTASGRKVRKFCQTVKLWVTDLCIVRFGVLLRFELDHQAPKPVPQTDESSQVRRILDIFET